MTFLTYLLFSLPCAHWHFDPHNKRRHGIPCQSRDAATERQAGDNLSGVLDTTFFFESIQFQYIVLQMQISVHGFYAL
jgi:hypothetical protein